MADEKKDDITAFAKARLQDPSPRKARRQGRHRNSHSTTAVPELWLRVSERRADHFEEDCEVEGDDWYFSGPYSAESSSLRAEAGEVLDWTLAADPHRATTRSMALLGTARRRR